MSAQRQQEEQQKRRKKQTLHRKHKERRAKDIMTGIPFVMGFLGDPALRWRCAQSHYRTYYDLIPYGPQATKRNNVLRKFNLLRQYGKHPIQELFKMGGRILIKNAPEDNGDWNRWRGKVEEKVENIEKVVSAMDRKMDNFLVACNKHDTSINLLNESHSDHQKWIQGHAEHHRTSEKKEEAKVLFERQISMKKLGLIIGGLSSVPVVVVELLKLLFHIPV